MIFGRLSTEPARSVFAWLVFMGLGTSFVASEAGAEFRLVGTAVLNSGAETCEVKPVHEVLGANAVLLSAEVAAAIKALDHPGVHRDFAETEWKRAADQSNIPLGNVMSAATIPEAEK